MPSVLAIESHHERAAALRELIDERVHGQLTVVDSIDAAIAAIAQRVPEVILVSALMAPKDDAELVARLRTLPKTACVQTLITPLLASPSKPARGRDRFKFRSAPKPTGCDPSTFADQVKIYLDQVRDLRTDLAAPTDEAVSERRSALRVIHADGVRVIVDGRLVNLIDLSVTGAQVLSPALLVPGHLVQVVFEKNQETIRCQAAVVWGEFEAPRSSGIPQYRAGVDLREADHRFLEGLCSPPMQLKPTTVDVLEVGPVICPRLTPAQHRAPRLGRGDLPWISTVKLPCGLEMSLLNISSSGMLVETVSKFTPGTVVELRLCGAVTTLAVPARFVRSEVAAVDGRGVKYHAAAVFDKELDLEGLHRSGAETSSTSTGLAGWLLQIATELDRGADPRALRHRIERGLRRLVPARDVQIREAPIAPEDGCESVYFTVAMGIGPRAVLQVTFEPGQAPSDLDFRLLQAGAALAAVVLRFGGIGLHYIVPR